MHENDTNQSINQLQFTLLFEVSLERITLSVSSCIRLGWDALCWSVQFRLMPEVSFFNSRAALETTRRGADADQPNDLVSSRLHVAFTFIFPHVHFMGAVGRSFVRLVVAS